MTAARQSDTAKWHGLEPEQLIGAFRIMQTSRRLDDREDQRRRP
jgi:TPP-dependent pyruvate/acetoin dehydrogenase alpha subunit